MLRRLFDILALISLIICIAAVVLLVRSSWASDFLVIRRRMINRSTGQKEVYAIVSDGPKVGLFRATISPGNIQSDVIVSTHYGGIAECAALLPVLWCIGISSRRRSYRLAHGLCIHCGYDLRASPEQCPECGEGATIISGPRFVAHRSDPLAITIRPSVKYCAWLSLGGLGFLFLAVGGMHVAHMMWPRTLGPPLPPSLLLIVVIPLPVVWGLSLLLPLLYMRKRNYFVASQEGIEVCRSWVQPFLLPWRYTGKIRAPKSRVVICRHDGKSITALSLTSASDRAKLLALWRGFGVCISEE